VSEPGGLVALDGGTFLMGASRGIADPDDGEFPRAVQVEPFAIASCAVMNAAFAAFVHATGYVTDAERFGWSFVFAGLLPDDFPQTAGITAAPWWRQVYHASWKHPEGPGSAIADRLDHPVVHVSLHDALTYCRWSGFWLPSEAEWEFAARGGLQGQTFPWGDELEPNAEHRMNVWQGEFPATNTMDDGYYATAPVDAYEPNGYGLFNGTGNVWEWTAAGVQKGGSYLCHSSYCRRYRIASRQRPSHDSSAGNVGFRVCAGPGVDRRSVPTGRSA
jgi:formylglycine-generating enzyme required for sulfatase activity